jgi:dUTP pyrophosphatase
MSEDKNGLYSDLEELQKLIESLGEDNFKNISEEIGIDLNELEKQMMNQVPKMDLEYSSTNEKDLMFNYDSDSGFDLYSNDTIEIGPFGRALVPTGIRINIPFGFEVQVRTKSGLALNQGIMVLNSPGTIDEGYTGEIKVIIFNTNPESITINKGMKVAQAVLTRCVQGRNINFVKVDSFDEKDRNENGFGSTGI